MKEQMGFNAMISGVEQVNPLFSKCKIRVMTYGENENRSFISKRSSRKKLFLQSSIFLLLVSIRELLITMVVMVGKNGNH